jgi:4-amino-4-deoxy-L-arabinose transferase-like glycosyltransferase
VIGDARRRAQLGLALVLLAAGLLRFWSLSQGIGFNLGPDEPEVMERAVRMMKTGDLHPHFFDYPALYMYVQMAVSTARFMVGAIQGRWSSLAQAPVEDFYLWARAATALLGTATVWVLYRAGQRWGEPTALLAAALVAVMPLHVRESHYVLTDVPVTFVVTVTFLLTLRAHERASAGSFALAGAAAGFAAALKYNGVFAVIMPLAGCALTWRLRPRRAVAALAVTAAMLAAFFVAAPYTLIDLPGFLNQFARLSSEYRKPPTIAEPIWLVYLKHLRIALGWPGMVFVGGGLALAAWRALRDRDRLRWILPLLFAVLYFRFVAQQTIVFARYLLPVVPFLSLLAAAFIVTVAGALRRAGLRPPVRVALVVALIALAIARPATTAVGYDVDAAKVSTQGLAYEWIRRELPNGSGIRLEGSVTLRLPAAYRASYAKQLWTDPPGSYAAQNVDYLVASSQCYGPFLADPAGYRVEYGAYQRLFAETDEIARFVPSPDHPGPELRILKVRRS